MAVHGPNEQNTREFLPPSSDVKLVPMTAEHFQRQKNRKIAIWVGSVTGLIALVALIGVIVYADYSLVYTPIHKTMAADRVTVDELNRKLQVAEARAAGFEHVNLDLIYGAPYETDDDWQASLLAAIAAGPDHISAYALVVEEGTGLARQVATGVVPAPDDDVLADRYVQADETLRGAGGLHTADDFAVHTTEVTAPIGTLTVRLVRR